MKPERQASCVYAVALPKTIKHQENNFLLQKLNEAIKTGHDSFISAGFHSSHRKKKKALIMWAMMSLPMLSLIWAFIAQLWNQ